VIGTRFYDRKEVKDIMSYFRAILNKDDCASLKRIINTPTRGIGDTTVETIDGLYLQLLRKTPTATYWDAVKEATTTGAVTIAITKKLNQFVLLLERLRHDSLSLSLAELFQLVIAETKYVAALQKEYGDEAEERLANLEELRLLLENFDESQTDKANLLSQFLEQAALVQAESNDVELSVKLMTCHAAKGLEFLTVFLVGMEEGLFPSTRARNEEDDNVEEERRLCYVGMTRARERLYLSYAARRMVWGRTENRIPARFFGEISKKLRVSSLT
jgi:DNA helicase-2/ATP-dependent DNA helicase PcrA